MEQISAIIFTKLYLLRKKQKKDKFPLGHFGGDFEEF
jgi:hypothetical protein